MKAEMIEGRDAAFSELLQLYKAQGYLTIDDIFSHVDKMSLPIDDVDRLCEEVSLAGVIVLNEAPSSTFERNESSVEYHYDKTRLDYNRIYNRVVKRDNSLAGYVEKLRLILPPQLREESTLIHHAKAGNTFVRERIITMYLKVALRLAVWYHDKYGLPLDETIQEANVGLLLALEKIPDDGQKRFSTYATWWIRQNIERRAQGISRTFYNMPVHVKQKLLVVTRLKRRHSRSHNCDFNELHCPVLVTNVCDKLSIDASTASYYLDLLNETLSIEKVDDQIDEALNSHYEISDDVTDKLQLEYLLSSLTEREHQVLALRYGLYDQHQRTLEEVGAQLGVTRERIRQIESKALKRMRQIAVS